MFLYLSLSHSVHRSEGASFPACTGKGKLVSQHALGRGSVSGERRLASRGLASGGGGWFGQTP